MSIAAAFVWEVRTDGSDDNGGGFKTGASGTDRSQQAAAHVTIDGATISAVVHTTTTQLTIAGYTVAAADVGNCVNVNGGTATAGRYEITAVDTGNNRWTLDRSVGTAAQTATGRMGGALASIGELGKSWNASGSNTSGQKAYVKTGTYTLTTTTPNISGGPISLPSAVQLLIEGYSSTRGDLGTPPTFDCAALTGFTVFTAAPSFGSASQFLVNLKVDGNDNATVVGFSLGGSYHNGYCIDCQAVDCPTGFKSTAGNRFIRCKAASCATYGFQLGLYSKCEACVATTSAIGFLTAQGVVLVDCISHANTGDGFQVTAYDTLFINCTAYGNGGDGFDSTPSYDMFHWINCVSVGNTGYGFNEMAATGHLSLKCAGYNNTSGNRARTPFYDPSFISLSGDPFIDGAAGDFRLNNTAGAGALLRALGIGPIGQTNARDIGAVQVASGGSSGGSRLVGPSGLVGRSF